MNADRERRISIDDRFDSYRTIFNHAWAGEIEDATNGTRLDPLVFALGMSWRAAANTHVLPWLVVNSLNKFWESYAQHMGFTPRFVGAMATEIPRRMEGTRISNMQRKALAKAVQEFADQIHQTLQNNPDPELSSESLWEQFLDPSCWEFRVSIWGSQQLVFGAIFFAYENFVTELVTVGNAAVPGYKPPLRYGALVEHAKTLLDPVDPTVVQRCLEDQFVTVTRLARNCLAHRGGRESDELRKTGHGLAVVDGVINIMAPDNENALRGLEERVSSLVQAALRLPQFQ